MSQRNAAGRRTDGKAALAGRAGEYGTQIVASMAREVANCFAAARASDPGGEGYEALRDAELGHAVRLGKVSAKILMGLGKLSGRYDHNIAITRPDPRGPVSTDALLEAYRRYQDTRRGSFPSYHGLPEEDLARIAAAMDEQELRITPEEMESEDFMALDRRLKAWRMDRAERRRVLLHEADRARLTHEELLYLSKGDFANRLEIYAFARMEEAERREDGKSGQIDGEWTALAGGTKQSKAPEAI
jgi:hypothetical protein